MVSPEEHKGAKNMGPDEMHLWILRQQADEVSKLISVIFGNFCCSSEASDDWKRGKFTPQF